MNWQISIVESYVNLDANNKISSRGADMVAQLFNDGFDTVVFLSFGWRKTKISTP